MLSLTSFQPECMLQCPPSRRVCRSVQPILPVVLALPCSTPSWAAEIRQDPPTWLSPKFFPHFYHDPQFQGPVPCTGDHRPLNRTSARGIGRLWQVSGGIRTPSGQWTAVPQRVPGPLTGPAISAQPTGFLIYVVMPSADQADWAGRKRGQ